MTPNVHALHDDALANTSYLVDVGDGHAFVVDPPRDIDHHLDLAAQLAVEIVATFDTHVHADYVSGATELSARGAEAIVPAGAHAEWAHTSIAAGDRRTFGSIVVHAIATPGHTPEHLAYLLEVDGEPRGVFTGGSLILGGAARTDLMGAGRTDELARAQFHSLRALSQLPDATAVYPTHGAGSFCLAVATTTTDPTIGTERTVNPLLSADDEDTFVRELTAGFGSFPTYYRSLQALNEAGPPLVASLPAPPALTPADVHRRMQAGAWLIDARPIAEWAAAHPVGAVSDELRPAFASWLGWVVPFGTPVILIVDPAQRDEATRLARRIGYDDLAFLDGGIAAWRAAGLPTAAVESVDAPTAYRRQHDGTLMLDVRQDSEVAVLQIPGAQHIELGDIIAGKLPAGTHVITFCGHGERSATAASLLERRGVQVANLAGGTTGWVDAGLPTTR